MSREDVRLDQLPPDAARRVLMTVAATDADVLPKVPGAGQVRDKDGTRVQIMHNGLLIEEGCYYGPWMTEIIRGLDGHHEPQEELVFARVLERLGDTPDPVMIEFGSFWTYYGMWFASAFPSGRVVAMEPDPAYLEVGRRNWALNGLANEIDFVHGAVGADPGADLDFVAESDGRTYQVRQHDLASLLAEQGLERVDLIISDIQGAETVLLERARPLLSAGAVRFLIVSTHHHSISGSPLTHRDALALLRECGGHIIAEHTVAESQSGDGMIAVSFDERDKDLSVVLSHARAQDSLFGGLELDLNHALHEQAQLSAELAVTTSRLEAAEAARRTAQDELAATQATKLFRMAKGPRALYARLRGRS